MTDDRERQERNKAADYLAQNVPPGFVRIDIGNGCGVLVTESALRACGWVPKDSIVTALAFENMSDEIDALRKELDGLQAELAACLANLKATEEARDAYRSKMRILQEQYNESDNDRKEARRFQRKFSDERDAAQSDLKLTRDGWANDSKHLHAEIDRLTGDLASAMDSIEFGAAEFNALALANAELEVDFADMAQAYASAMQELGAVQ
jgi:chromosome segregation ATPase